MLETCYPCKADASFLSVLTSCMLVVHTGQAVDSNSEFDDEEMTNSDMTSSSDDERREPSIG